ncbi:MAG: Trp family transcriptional regulator [Patescibacteria group bacterium]
MPQVSKYPLRKEVYERIFELLLKTVADSHGQKEATQLIDDLLTPTEKIMLAKRLSIAVLLAKGYSYKDIQEIVRVSKPTIAIVNLYLKHGRGGYRRFVEKVLREEKIGEFWEKVEDLVLSAGSKGKGSGVWRYLRDERRKKRWEKRTEI